MRRLAGLLLVLASGSAGAGPWEFTAPIDVSGAGDTVFHHLDSSGRRSIAVSGAQVAVTWEDDRDGTPRVYLARKPLAGGSFSETRLSGAGEAFEPAVATLSDGRFLVVWEEAGQVMARVPDGPALQLSSAGAAQASLAAEGNGAVAVYAERAARYAQIRLRRLRTAEGGALTATEPCAVDRVEPVDEQLYPSAAFSGGRLVVAWEDRRPRHTVILAAVEGSACEFAAPHRLSQRPDSAGGANLPFGAGHGVARVALAGYGAEGVFAAWADKRNFRHGYDIWGADFEPTRRQFGSNVLVQDEFGELAAQWDPSVAGHRDGTLVVAWDDGREGTADILLSWREAGVWSEDMPLPGAAGDGEQAHPSITLDGAGDLHAVWVQREARDGPTRLRYARGQRVGGDPRASSE